MIHNSTLQRLKEKDGYLVFLRREQVQVAANILLRNDWAATLHRLLRTELVSNGFYLKQCSGELIEPPRERVQFFETAVTNLLISGVVAFDFKEDGTPMMIMYDQCFCKERTGRISLVTSHTIRMREPKLGSDWMVVRNLAKRKQPPRFDIDPSAFVFTSADAPSICTGEIYSIGMTIAGQCTLHTTRVTGNIVENILRANPPLLLQRQSDLNSVDVLNETIAAADDAEVLRNTWIAARGSADDQEYKSYEQERERSDQEMQDLTTSLTQGVITTPRLTHRHLPAGETLVPFPFAPTRSDIEEAQTTFGKFLSSAFGIPLAVLDGDFTGARHRADDAAAATTLLTGEAQTIFQKYLLTLEMWQQQLTLLLRVILEAPHGTPPADCWFVSKRVLELQRQLNSQNCNVENDGG